MSDPITVSQSPPYYAALGRFRHRRARNMLDWLEDLTPTELSKQSADYETLASAASLEATREAFGRLAARCAALAVERVDIEGR